MENEFEVVESEVENIFSNLVNHFELKRGDISPLQNIQVEDFKLMLVQFVKQNNGCQDCVNEIYRDEVDCKNCHRQWEFEEDEE